MAFSVREAVAAAAEQLAAAKIAAPHREASLLLATVLNDQPEILYREPERILTERELAGFSSLVQRRASREPMSHITGVREFWSLEFKVGPDVLDPRPDSETLIQTALDSGLDREAAVTLLDLGTGSGCLLLALLSEFPGANGLGVDASERAIRIARENSDRLGFSDRSRFQRGNWASGISEQFDLIVSNPPYISDAQMPLLQPEVRLYEPHLALHGGADGLTCYRAIVAELDRLLKPGGQVVFEVGQGQARDVSNLLEAAGFEGVTVTKDLAGIDRCVAAQKRNSPPF